jgi:hypothetical protein
MNVYSEDVVVEGAGAGMVISSLSPLAIFNPIDVFGRIVLYALYTDNICVRVSLCVFSICCYITTCLQTECLITFYGLRVSYHSTIPCVKFPREQ